MLEAYRQHAAEPQPHLCGQGVGAQMRDVTAGENKGRPEIYAPAHHARLHGKSFHAPTLTAVTQLLFCPPASGDLLPAPSLRKIIKHA